MNYSTAHQDFSNRLQKPEALTNPENFLGPNYETVLNFWTFMDSLTEDNWKEVARRYCALDSTAWDAARDAAWAAARAAARAAAGEAAREAARAAARIRYERRLDSMLYAEAKKLGTPNTEAGE